jgi:hypothetical protein
MSHQDALLHEADLEKDIASDVHFFDFMDDLASDLAGDAYVDPNNVGSKGGNFNTSIRDKTVLLDPIGCKGECTADEESRRSEARRAINRRSQARYREKNKVRL